MTAGPRGPQKGNNLRLLRHHPVLDNFAAQLALRCGERWDELPETVRDYYREVSRDAINDGLRAVKS